MTKKVFCMKHCHMTLEKACGLWSVCLWTVSLCLLWFTGHKCRFALWCTMERLSDAVYHRHDCYNVRSLNYLLGAAVLMSENPSGRSQAERINKFSWNKSYRERGFFFFTQNITYLETLLRESPSSGKSGLCAVWVRFLTYKDMRLGTVTNLLLCIDSPETESKDNEGFHWWATLLYWGPFTDRGLSAVPSPLCCDGKACCSGGPWGCVSLCWLRKFSRDSLKKSTESSISYCTILN